MIVLGLKRYIAYHVFATISVPSRRRQPASAQRLLRSYSITHIISLSADLFPYTYFEFDSKQ